MPNKKKGARQKVLEAADEIACEAGPANLSLDAVALKAGVSKGGLLYHFPSKTKLLEAVVEAHLQAFDNSLTELEKRRQGAPNSVIEAYLELFPQEHARKKQPPASAILAALVENPDLMAPVRRYERRFLDRMKENASDPAMALVAFLALHGARHMALLKVDVLRDEELDAAL
jgi:AcrR family transcriptional regulator